MFGGVKPIAERNRELQEILDLYSPQAKKESNILTSVLYENEILKIMFGSKNGEKYKRLYGGDTSGYPSHSEANQALCNILCFFAKGDKIIIDNLFRQSGLMRPKWDEKHGANTYGDMTIQEALNSVKSYYSSATTQAPKWEAPIPFKSMDLPTFPTNELPPLYVIMFALLLKLHRLLLIWRRRLLLRY